MPSGGHYVMPPAHFWVGELRNQTSSPLGWGKLRNCPHPSTRVGILRVIRAADTGSTSSAICICVVQEALRRITPKLLRCIRHQLDAAQNFGEAQYSLGHVYGQGLGVSQVGCSGAARCRKPLADSASRARATPESSDSSLAKKKEFIGRSTGHSG